MQLVPCAQCRRHVDASSERCPFCAGSRGPALALALAAGLVLAGCPAARPEPVYGGPPPPDEPVPPVQTVEPVPSVTAAPSATVERPSVEAYGAPAPPPPKK